MDKAFGPGAVSRRQVRVDPGRTIDFLGEDCRVYATPELVRDIEMTCRDFIKAHLGEGQDSVGTRMEIDHVAATPLDLEVEIEVRVTALEGRAVRFDFTCRDPLEICARGQHQRYIVDAARTAERVRAKIARAGAGDGGPG